MWSSVTASSCALSPWTKMPGVGGLAHESVGDPCWSPNSSKGLVWGFGLPNRCMIEIAMSLLALYVGVCLSKDIWS